MPEEERCKHSQRAILAARLRLYGYVSTYDAIYTWRCPMDGNLRRNTRLAANVFQLRREGWVIETVEKPGKLAAYRLVSEPDVRDPGAPY